jgi:nitrous oxidase accessory protein NosD
MRRLMVLACAAALGISLSSIGAGAALASVTAPGAAHRWLIVVSPGQSIQAAVNRAHPGWTVRIEPGVYHQSVQIRTSGITLLGSGNLRHGTVLKPPRHLPRTVCNRLFGATGVCVLATKVNVKTGKVIKAVRNVKISGLKVEGFRSNGVFGYGTNGLTVTHVTAVSNGAYGISRFESTRTLFARDIAIGSHEAGFYVGDSPQADTVVRDNIAKGNALGIFIRHARHVVVFRNLATHNCQGVLVLDDGQKGGAGNAVIRHNRVSHNNQFCPASEEAPKLQGGGILLLGATRVRVGGNRVIGNRGHQINSGGIVVLSARQLTHGHNPKDILVTRNIVRRNRPFDLRWDGTGRHIRFARNRCATSSPAGLCH